MQSDYTNKGETPPKREAPTGPSPRHTPVTQAARPISGARPSSGGSRPTNSPKSTYRSNPTGEFNPRISPPPRPVGVEPELQTKPPQVVPTSTPQFIEVPVAPDAFRILRDKTRSLNSSFKVIAYVAIVLCVDILATKEYQTPVNWSAFQWHPETFFSLAERMSLALNLPYGVYGWMLNPLVQGIDLYKITFWLLLPFIFTWRGMDWGYWRTIRWRSEDLWILSAIAGLGIGAMFTVKFIPEVQEFYPSRASLSFASKADFVVTQLFWIFSWIIGYEFLMRYVLLQRFDLHWPRFGWLMVPLFDGAYHLVKSVPEMAAMVVFGLFLTWWTRKRRNLLLPLIAHLIIEVELIAFLVLF